ncbi:MAG: type II secretion system protein GspG [SAR324 cluster bacterium]|uniref:Type II secretion system protein GspG n=1 Tax=SAR324 cluster bacterium TaxID=2024889 RepID=A0A2A4T7I1_9DELT|nr:MAG: type II secretion system protein GspG [SAR324 cluster bacterium]
MQHLEEIVEEASPVSQPTKNQQSGFSFLEIMIIIVIMAGIAAIVGPSLFGKLDEAKIDQAKIQMKNISAALDLYHLDTSMFPSTDQGLESMLSKPEVGRVPRNWRGPYLKGSTMPKDPWSRDYVYLSDGGSFQLRSLGADGEEGGEGTSADIEFKP